MRKVVTTISILLLLIGGTYAQDNTSSIVTEDNMSNMVVEDNVPTEKEGFTHKLSNDTNTSTGYASSIYVTVDKDTNGSGVKEDLQGDIVFGDTETISIEKKSSPGFGSIVTMIVFLSLVAYMIRRR